MRALFLILLVSLVALVPGEASRRRLLLEKANEREQSAGGGGGGASFSDDFNRADSASLGANWTEAQGDAKILSNAYTSVTGSFGQIVSIYSGAACTTTDQYVRATLAQFPASSQIHSIFLRYTDASTEFYEIQISSFGNTIKWMHWTAIAGTQTEIASQSYTPTYPVTALGVTISGTGNSTVINVWTDASGLPTGDGNWNGDTSPNFTFTDNPANPVDAGNYVGIGGLTSTEFYFDDFAGGDTP